MGLNAGSEQLLPNLDAELSNKPKPEKPINLVKPDNSLTDQNIKDLSLVRSEIKRLTSPLTEHEQGISLPKKIQTNTNPVNLVGKIKQSLARMKYPGGADTSNKLIRSTLPLLSTTLIAAIPGFVRLIEIGQYTSGAISELNPVLGQIVHISNPASLLLTIPVFADSFINLYVMSQESKNRKLYGKLLTVNKTKTISNSTVGRTFPEITEDFYGEMHFLGKSTITSQLENDDLFHGNPITIVRQGLSDLLTLAQACQNNSPELEGINVFVGPYSPMVSERFERFGFKVKPPIYDEQPIDAFFGPVLSSLNNLAYRLFGIKSIDRSSMACLITREELINQIPNFQKFVK